MRRNSNNNVQAKQRRRVICSAGSHPRPGLRAPGASDFIPFLVEERSENKRQQQLAHFTVSCLHLLLLIPLADERTLDCKQTRSGSENLLFFWSPPSFLCLLSTYYTFSGALIDLCLLFRLFFLSLRRTISLPSAPGAHAKDRSAPGPAGIKADEEFCVCLFIFFKKTSTFSPPPLYSKHRQHT